MQTQRRKVTEVQVLFPRCRYHLHDRRGHCQQHHLHMIKIAELHSIHKDLSHHPKDLGESLIRC